jgi:hypothetical protein
VTQGRKHRLSRSTHLGCPDLLSKRYRLSILNLGQLVRSPENSISIDLLLETQGHGGKHHVPCVNHRVTSLMLDIDWIFLEASKNVPAEGVFGIEPDRPKPTPPPVLIPPRAVAPMKSPPITPLKNLQTATMEGKGIVI